MNNKEPREESLKSTLGFIAGTAVMLGVCAYHFIAEYKELKAELKEKQVIETRALEYQNSIDSIMVDYNEERK